MTTRSKAPGPGAPPARNEVALTGRVSAAAEERSLPSGDVIVLLRVVVARPERPRRPERPDASEQPGQPDPTGAARSSTIAATDTVGRRRQTVDTIDVVCWTSTTRRAAARLAAGDVVDVEGALRRRFFGGAAGRQSRYEVEALRVRRVARAPQVPT
ncbi:MAG TPA: single-stranded DNA-binding protein [Intrasporangium sp.]|uniref:single-stranded DNA-binding protein n=1 Tax=Intrasporangium sp. TaxID=1925024 RepID=UPI002D7718E9|nr:single-stranded DNA-binding protein [Intrasporangium sp.]HET7396889.1 single-stranded DNA-binding protein [Intrasporangium sp.]